MKERPILMSAPMVISTLNGTKGQTRRIATWRACGGKRQEVPASIITEAEAIEWLTRHGTLECPYGNVGDVLWVRETWQPFDDIELGTSVRFLADGSRIKPSNWTAEQGYWCETQSRYSERWRPCIHMPRWASRITLTLTGVRIERLQDITDEDAINEGIEWGRHDPKLPIEGYKMYGGAGVTNDPRLSYRTLWEHINGLGSWKANPWVWVLKFERRTVA